MQKQVEINEMETFEIKKTKIFVSLPFHHLIPAAQMTSAFNTSEMEPAKGSFTVRESRLQLFWQSLADSGISAREAALFDDLLELYITEHIDGQLFEYDWRVILFDELEGCAEVYLAEMFLCKRWIYEAGNGLKNILKLTSTDLEHYLPLDILRMLEVKNIDRLFLDSLSATFILTVGNEKSISEKIKGNQTNKKVRKRKKSNSNIFNTNNYASYATKKVEGWTSQEEVIVRHLEESESKIETSDHAVAHTDEIECSGITNSTNFSRNIYHAKLTSYWLEWQRSAHLAKFDFDYLHTLNDARTVRFYELTKMWRVLLINQVGDKIPDKLEIEYEKFVLLMPLPKFNSEREIIEQIRKLIKPLKHYKYVRSFRLKNDWKGITNRYIQLVFRFND